MERSAAEERRVLVVDDDERFLAAVARILNSDGYEVVAAPSSGRALAELRARSFAAVVSDYFMGDGTGIELLRVVAERWPETARLLISGVYDDKILVGLAERVGADGTLQKPVSAESLCSTLQHAIAQAAARRERSDERRSTPAGPLPLGPGDPTSPSTAPAPRARVLVVHQDLETQENVRAALAPRFETVTAADTDGAVARLAREAFDLVLVQNDLPGTNGIELLARIKEAWPDLEGILLTAEANLDIAIDGMRAGAADLVVMPFEPNDLLGRVERLIARRAEWFTLALSEASKLVFASHDRESLPRQVVSLAARIMGADDASLMFPDGSDRLYVAFSSAPARQVKPGQPLSMNSCIAGRVAAGHRPVLLSGELAEDPRFTGLPSSGRPASSIVYPLYSGNQLVAVLNLNRMPGRRPFVERDIERASLLASHIVLALDNARLLRSLIGAEKLAAVGQLAASIVHEINNPLAYVLSNVEFARESLFDLSRTATAHDEAWCARARAVLGEAALALDDAENGSKRIMAIVQDMRVISRADSSGASMFDVNDTIRSALRIAGARLQRTVKVETRLEPGLSVRGNAGQLSQVFLNLVINAEEAMIEARSTRRNLRVTSWREGEQVLVCVSDTGPGIPLANQSQIFAPFFTTKPEGKGTGLGLSISRDIVVRHGGQISVQSAPGNGAEFTVTLPYVGPLAGPEPDKAA